MFGSIDYCFWPLSAVEWFQRRSEGGFVVPEDRLDQVYNMVANLIQIMGHTNSIVEELRMDVNVLKAGQEELKAGQEELKARQEELRVGQEELRRDVDSLKAGQEEIKSTVARLEQKVDRLIENQAGIFEMLGDHDVAIRALRRKERIS